MPLSKKNKMKFFAIFLTVLALTGCIPRSPQLALKPRISELIDNGSKEMKLCRLECQKDKTQCEIKNNTSDIIRSGRAVYYNEYSMAVHDFSRKIENETCQIEFENCFRDICGGKVMVKQ
jgi:hypothetical protein